MGKIQMNALFRERQILEKIRSGEVSFRRHFKYEHSDWLQIVDFLLAKVHREQLYAAFYDHLSSGPPRDPEPTFDEWLSNIQTG